MTRVRCCRCAGACWRCGGPSSAPGLADFENLAVSEGVWAYRTGSLVVAANFTAHPAEMPAEAGEVLLTTTAGDAPASPGVLRPWEGVITRRPGSAVGHD